MSDFFTLAPHVQQVTVWEGENPVALIEYKNGTVEIEQEDICYSVKTLTRLNNYTLVITDEGREFYLTAV